MVFSSAKSLKKVENLQKCALRYLDSVTDLSFSASVPVVPNHSCSHICKSDRIINI